MGCELPDWGTRRWLLALHPETRCAPKGNSRRIYDDLRMNLAFEAHHQSETLKVEKLREKNKALLKQSKTLEDELAERRT